MQRAENREIQFRPRGIDRQCSPRRVVRNQTVVRRDEGDREIFGDGHDQRSGRLSGNFGFRDLRVALQPFDQGRQIIEYRPQRIDSKPSDDVSWLEVSRPANFDRTHVEEAEFVQQCSSPTWRGENGHAEKDEREVTIARLLETFWKLHETCVIRE